MPGTQLKAFLDREGIKYVTIRHEEIAFNAGTHTEIIKMTYRDFDRLVKPKVIDVST